MIPVLFKPPVNRIPPHQLRSRPVPDENLLRRLHLPHNFLPRAIKPYLASYVPARRTFRSAKPTKLNNYIESVISPEEVTKRGRTASANLIGGCLQETIKSVRILSTCVRRRRGASCT